METLIENQQEQLQLLRQLTSAGSVTIDGMDEAAIHSSIRTMQELQDLNDKLCDADFFKKMVGVTLLKLSIACVTCLRY